MSTKAERKDARAYDKRGNVRPADDRFLGEGDRLAATKEDESKSKRTRPRRRN